MKLKLEPYHLFLVPHKGLLMWIKIFSKVFLRIESFIIDVLEDQKQLYRGVCFFNFIEITLRHGFSPVNLLHIFRTPFYKSIYGGLLRKSPKYTFHFISFHFVFLENKITVFVNFDFICQDSNTMFSCEYCENFKNNFFDWTLPGSPGKHNI